MRAPLWRGVDRLVVACTADREPVAARLCRAAMADVGRDAPFAVVERVDAPALGRADAVIRFRVAEGALLVAVERGVVVDESEGVLVTRPVPLSASDDEALAAAVAQAMDFALPWRRSEIRNMRSRRS